MEEQAKRTETTASRVEYLLGLLRGLPQHDPPPALRERLELLSSERLGDQFVFGKHVDNARPGVLLWLKPAFLVVLLAVLGIAATLELRFHRPEHLPAVESRGASPKAPIRNGIRAMPEAPPPEAKFSRTRHVPSKWAQDSTQRRMIVRLPYSDSAIDTGTDATIRVSMSEVELVSLGFPMNTTLHDRRIVAELTLGDDGLPRAISVPLPLEVITEKK